MDLIGGKNEDGVDDEMNPVKQDSKELDYKGITLPRPKAPSPSGGGGRRGAKDETRRLIPRLILPPYPG